MKGFATSNKQDQTQELTLKVVFFSFWL